MSPSLSSFGSFVSSLSSVSLSLPSLPDWATAEASSTAAVHPIPRKSDCRRNQSSRLGIWRHRSKSMSEPSLLHDNPVNAEPSNSGAKKPIKKRRSVSFIHHQRTEASNKSSPVLDNARDTMKSASSSRAAMKQDPSFRRHHSSNYHHKRDVDRTSTRRSTSFIHDKTTRPVNRSSPFPNNTAPTAAVKQDPSHRTRTPSVRSARRLSRSLDSAQLSGMNMQRRNTFDHASLFQHSCPNLNTNTVDQVSSFSLSCPNVNSCRSPTSTNTNNNVRGTNGEPSKTSRNFRMSYRGPCDIDNRRSIPNPSHAVRHSRSRSFQTSRTASRDASKSSAKMAMSGDAPTFSRAFSARDCTNDASDMDMPRTSNLRVEELLQRINDMKHRGCESDLRQYKNVQNHNIHDGDFSSNAEHKSCGAMTWSSDSTVTPSHSTSARNTETSFQSQQHSTHSLHRRAAVNDWLSQVRQLANSNSDETLDVSSTQDDSMGHTPSKSNTCLAASSVAENTKRVQQTNSTSALSKCSSSRTSSTSSRRDRTKKGKELHVSFTTSDPSCVVFIERQPSLFIDKREEGFVSLFKEVKEDPPESSEEVISNCHQCRRLGCDSSRAPSVAESNQRVDVARASPQGVDAFDGLPMIGWSKQDGLPMIGRQKQAETFSASRRATQLSNRQNIPKLPFPQPPPRSSPPVINTTVSLLRHPPPPPLLRVQLIEEPVGQWPPPPLRSLKYNNPR